MTIKNRSQILLGEFVILITIAILIPFLSNIQIAKAEEPTKIPIWTKLGEFRASAGYVEPLLTPLMIIGRIVSILLSFLGIIALIIIIIGGWRWMTAGGNDEKIGEAKKLIGQGIIGLIIVLAAYVIALFVLEQLADKFIHTTGKTK